MGREGQDKHRYKYRSPDFRSWRLKIQTGGYGRAGLREPIFWREGEETPRAMREGLMVDGGRFRGGDMDSSSETVLCLGLLAVRQGMALSWLGRFLQFDSMFFSKIHTGFFVSRRLHI